MKVLCPQCERLIPLERYRVEGGALVVTCTKCDAQTRVEPEALQQPIAAAMPVPSAPPPRPPSQPPRVSLASSEGGSNVVVLRTAGHEAVQKAALAADGDAFAVPEGVCPKCIARRAAAEACPHCGIHYANFDEASVMPPKWLRDDWVSLLREWGNEARHTQLRRKAQQAEALPAVGRLYRLRQAFVPEDPIAENGRAEVLRMAAVGIAFRPPTGDETEKKRKAVLIGAFVVMAVLIAVLVMQLLRPQ